MDINQRSQHENEERIKARVNKTYNKFEQFCTISENNKKDKAIHIVLSTDDFGNNFQEDALVFNRVVDKIEHEVEGGLSKYFCWCYTIDTNSFLAHPELDTVYTWNGCRINTQTLIGERSKSGNFRRGEVFVMGIIKRNYIENNV